MSKAGAVVTLAGVACLGLGVATRWDGFFDERPGSLLLTSVAVGTFRVSLKD